MHISALLLFLLTPLAAQTPERPLRAVTDPGVVTTRQTITPAGVPTVFMGRVYGVAFGASADELIVLNGARVYRMDWKANRIIESIPMDGTPGLQAIRWDPVAAKPLFAFTARGRGAQVGLASWGDLIASGPGTQIAGAIDLARKRRIAVVPLTAQNKLAVIDIERKAVIGTAQTGIAPFGAVVSNDGSVAWVSNWGGRPPKKGELTAPTGLAPDADQVAIDSRGVAAGGSVTRIDLNTLQATHTVSTGLHPNGLVWDETKNRLYVSNNNSDSVSVIDTRTNALAQTFALKPFARAAAGLAPTAVALGGDALYVACGGINAIAVLDAATGRLRGMIPTAWYPNSLAVSPDGARLAVGSLLGAGSGWRDEPNKRFVHTNRGAVSVIDIPSAGQLASYTTAVAENNHLPLAGAPVPPPSAPATKAVAIPARSGDPSLIEHVVFIIKENRTYDQVFGDLPQGNGDPSLVMFGRDVTPNQHRLAEQFVLLDNLYATGGNSADGHQWVVQANEVAYCLWPGYAGRSYPFDGSDPLAYASAGFLWDYALARKKTVKVYGEYAPRSPIPSNQRQGLLERWQKGDDFTKEWTAKSPIPSLDKVLVRNFPAYTNAIPDVARAQIFIADLKAMGTLPNLVMLQLPSNHTYGTSPNVSTPKAMVADNDLALGQVVEALTRSKWWPKMAIFVIEDDAQNGVDHVDGHRTTALAISPYTRRGAVDSTFYSTQSMLKTIELILGLPTMSVFDLIAHDMRNSFTDTADLTPYTVEQPKQSLFELNPPLKALKGEQREAALASMRMRFDVPDAAPADKLNRILWRQVHDWKRPYPGTRTAVFAPLTLDLNDDER